LFTYSAFANKMQEITPAQLAQFYELSLDMFCMADKRGYFTYLNQAWENCLGYTRKELTESPYVDFVHPEDKESTNGASKRLNSGQLVMHFENRYVAKDGSIKWFSWMASPQPDGGVYAVARDITAQKEDARATELLLRKLELTNQELDRFAYVVSHDLKTPLRGIINLTEWIFEDMGENLKPEVAGHLRMLKERVARIQNMINDLLVYSRTGRSQARIVDVDLDQLLIEILETVELPKGFQVSCPEALPTVSGVRVELFQLFQNLLVNAVKYRSSDHGTVKIAFKEFKKGYEFRIEDDGIGIAPKHHQKVFEIFHRLGESPEVEGTGVGLAIVKKIIDAAGGEIKVESSGGVGTTFVFTWPKEFQV
jgi:two-component system sensor kinase FixL